MKRYFLTAICKMFVLSSYAGSGKYVGGDISMLPKAEANISYYKDDHGKRIGDLVTWLVDSCGWNTFRVRLFVHPDPNYGKTYYKQSSADNTIIQDLDYVKALGKRIKESGANFMLDLHYSDFWVDASKIGAPAAWRGASDAVMADSVGAYTRMVLDTLIANGATPDMVQIGNEIMYGMCGIQVHPYDKDGDNWTGFAGLLRAGSEAVREKCPEAEIILHTDRPCNSAYINYWYGKVAELGVDYDVIGLSYYPFWHGTITPAQATQCIGYTNGVNLKESLDNLAQNFPTKKVHIVEFAYNFQYSFDGPNYSTEKVWPISKDGQYQVVSDLIALCTDYPQVEGLNYWYPEDAGNGDYVSAWDGTDPRMIESNWSNRGMWDENASKSGHTINMSQGRCVAKKMREFLEGVSNGIEDADAKASNVRKTYEDGQIVIVKEGERYTILGTKM